MTPEFIRKVDQRTLEAVRLSEPVRTRVTELARRLSEATGRSSGVGLLVVFTGPSGTGKTVAASIEAEAVGMSLYRVNLGAVITKYIGETEKNLERVFAEAEALDVVLLLDEADALLGKRTEGRDSHDRYANVEASYLLERLEGHVRPVIMAANLRSEDIDDALRRAAEVIEVPEDETTARRPSTPQVGGIWTRIRNLLARR